MLLISDIVGQYGLNLMFYSVGNQLYISFCPVDTDPNLQMIQTCISEMHQ